MNGNLAETFYGLVTTTHDAFLLFESCLNGILPVVSRRLTIDERKRIRSGSVFVFDENSSNIKRWTDGRVWSSSRVQVERVYPNSYAETSPQAETSRQDMQEERRISSYRGTFRVKQNGLIKKAMSLEVRGRSLHLVSYYCKQDLEEGKLATPPQTPALSAISLVDEVRMERALVGKHRAQVPQEAYLNTASRATSITKNDPQSKPISSLNPREHPQPKTYSTGTPVAHCSDGLSMLSDLALMISKSG